MATPPSKSRMIFLYSLIEQVESKLEELPTILFIVRFYEFLFLIYLILRNSIISPVYNSTGIFNPEFTDIDFYLNYQEVSQTILLASGIFTAGFFLLISLTQIKSRRFEKGILIWISVFVVLFMRIVYVFVINQSINTFLKTEEYPNLGNYRYVLIAPVLLFVVYSTLVNRSNYIFGLMHPLLFAMHNFDTTNYALFCIIFVTFIYRFIYDSENDNNSYVNTCIVAIVFYLLEEGKADIQYVEFCFLFFFLLMCLTHRFWRPLRMTVISEKRNASKRSALSDKKQILDEYYAYIKNKKQSAMKIEHQLFIQSIILDQYDQCQQSAVERLKPFTTGIKVADWTTNDHLKFLLSQVELYHADGKSKDSQIMLFLFRLEDVRLHYGSLLEISEHFYNQSVFTIQKYYLYKLMIKLQNWFKRFKGESAYVYDSMETDDMVLKFYSSLEKLLKLFLQIWGAIKKTVIDFSIIEPLYIQAISQYAHLERLLVQIRERVKSNNEIHKFNQLSNLLQLKVLSKLDIKMSFMDDQREQQVPFLRISKRKIIYSSYKFNHRFHYTNDEIIGINVNQLLPESFRQSFISSDQEQEQGVHLKLKQFHSIILNGKGCLEFVKITPYIEIDFFGQITYMVFFTPETQSNSSFILYSIQTDIIQELSNGFLELFNLQCKDVHNTVTGKQAFQEYDFSANKNRENLSVQGNMVHTNISIFQFKSTIVDRFNKIPVSLKVVHLFNFNGSVRLLLQVKLLTAECYKNLIPGIGLFVEGLLPTNTNPVNSTPKIQSGQSLITDESSENKKFMADLIEKKQTFNRDKSKNNFTANHWKSILRCCLFLIAVLVLSVIFFYASEWYTYMQNQILQLNQKIANLASVFENQFILGMSKKWPSQYISQAQNQKLIASYYEKLTLSIDNLYTSISKSLKDLTLPMMDKFRGGVNSGVQIKGGGIDMLDIISNSYLIFTEDIVEYVIEKYPVVTIMLNQAPNIEDNFYIFRMWMNVCLIVCVITLVMLIVIRVYQIYEDKILEKILEDIEMLFSFLKDEQITVCTESIQKTIDNFQKLSEVKAGKAKSKEVNIIEKKLKYLKHKNSQTQPFLQKKTSKTSGSSTKTMVKSFIYAVIMILFFAFSITFILSLKTQMPNIIRYQNQIQIAVRKTQTNLVNSYYYMINQKLGKNVELKLNNLFSTILIKNDYLIPSQFKQFYGEIWDILNMNICLISQQADMARCKSSILSRGLVNTLDYNLNNIKKFSLRGADKMFSDGLYDQLMFLRKYLIKQMQSILNLYYDEMTSYLSYRKSMYTIIILSAVLITLVTIFLIWMDYKDEINRNSICKSLFNIFPQSFFLKPQIRKYLEQINLIQRILQF